MIEKNKRLYALEKERNKQKLQDVLQIQEKERARIGMDIHDDLGPILSAIRNKTSLVAGLNADDRGYLNKLIDYAIDQTRSISRLMFPNTLTQFGLMAALEELADHIEKSSNITVMIHRDGEFEDFTQEKKLCIYRIIQEFCNNSLKHSNCTNINIFLNRRPDILGITLNDNGDGLPEEENERNLGLGQRSMEMRADMLGMDFNLISETGKGLTLKMYNTN